MRGDTLSTAWLAVLLTASPVHADFTKFSFAGNGGNVSASLTCPDWPFECPPPSVCAYESRTQNYYCCIAGSEDGVCWGPSQTCQGSNGKKPGGNQRLCGSGNNAFCCLQQSEVCTETADQINICWSSLSDPLAKLNATAVNETAHSLSSAQPSASSYPVSLDALQKLTSTTAASSPTPVSSSTRTSVATSSTSSPSAATSSPVEQSDSGLSGGAIGGIVGGVVGGLALIGVAGLLLWRRKKNAGNPYAPANSSEAAPTYAAETPAEMNAETYAEAPASEKYARYGGPVAEAPAESILAELPATEPPHQR